MLVVTVVIQHVCSPNAEFGLQGTRSVVYSSVYHATVMARLMGSWRGRRDGGRKENEGRKGERREEGFTTREEADITLSIGNIHFLFPKVTV